MISAMPAVAVRRGRKRSKTFGRFNLPSSHHSSTASLSNGRRGSRHGHSISTISYGGRAFQRRGGAAGLRYDTELDRQRRRFLIYMGTLLLMTGLLLVFIGVGARVPTAQQVGLLLIGVGALLCIIKVFCSEAHMTDLPVKAVPPQARDDDEPETNSGGGDGGEEEEATPLANISEFTELPGPESENNGAAVADQRNSLASPNETQVLIGNSDSSAGRY